MKNILTYKGYMTLIHFDAESNVLYGKIEGIRDLVNFECDNIKNVEKEFHSAVDDYLNFCASRGDEPEKPFKGNFNVRVDSTLHRDLYQIAVASGETLNRIAENAFREYVSRHNV